jgi:hypothetical protein
MAATVPVRGGVAEPQLELWLESGRPVSPDESARATAEARAALGSALAGVSAPQGDAVLVVRAQGVARTDSRRSDQRAAVAGLVVGAVVVVAAVVAIVVATNGKGLGKGGGGSRAVAAAPRVARPIVRVPGSMSHGARVARWPGIDVNAFAGLEVPPPAPPQGEPPSAGSTWDEPSQGWASQAPPPPPLDDLAEVSLPQPPPLDVADRGFFAGDALRLELVVVDRRDGTPLWSKVVEAKVDPRDARAVRRLLDHALAEEAGWMPASWEES